jgi:Protein of unknown function (DUF2442)
MTTSARKPRALARAKNPKQQRAFVPTSALAKAVECDDEMMRVTLTDGRILAVPLVWFPALQDATLAQRRRYEIGGGGVSLHWPELDEDISIAGLMAGADLRST